MNNDRLALKSGIWYTVCNFLLRCIGFITTPIFTRLLTQEDFGAYNNYTSWVSILTILVTLDLGATLISAKFDYKEKFDEYVLSVLALSSLSCVIWFAVAHVFADRVMNLLGMDMFYINCLLIYLFFYSAVNLFQIRERYLFAYKGTVFSSIFITVGTAFLSVVLVLTMENRLTGRIIGSIVPTILLGAILYVYFIRKGKRIDVRCWKYALPICLPYIPHLLSLTLLNSMDRVMITRICGKRDNALYSLAYNCGTIVTLLMTSLNGAFSPWLGEQLHAKAYDRIRRISKKYILIFCYLAAGVMLLAPEVLLVLGGKAYLPAKYVMPPVAMGCVCQFLYTLFVNVEQFEKKTIGMAFASCAAAAVNYVLNALLIPVFGYVAAAYTTLAGFLLLLIMHMLLVRHMGYAKVYSYRFIILVTLVMMGMTAGINVVYSYDYIRYAILGVYVLIFIFAARKYKSLIINFVRKKTA